MVWKPGDVLAFRGRGWVARLVSFWTFGPSHVAIVAGRGDHPGIPLVFWESTSRSKLPCCVQKRKISGVQAHSLGNLSPYDGTIWHLAIKKPLDPGEADELAKACYDRRGRCYDFGGAALAGTHWIKRILWWRTVDRSSQFCSEFVGDVLFDATCRRDEAAMVPLNWGQLTPVQLCRRLVESGTHHAPVKLRFGKRVGG